MGTMNIWSITECRAAYPTSAIAPQLMEQPASPIDVRKWDKRSIMELAEEWFDCPGLPKKPAAEANTMNMCISYGLF